MRVRPTARPLAALVAAVLGGSLAAAAPADAASKPKSPVTPIISAAPADFFGMHVNGLQGKAPVPSNKVVGSVRLWDTGTTWADLQPTGPTSWNWKPLDDAINHARRARLKPLVVFGQAPQWAGTNASQVAPGYGPGSASMPKSLVAWRAYVTAVVAHASRLGVTDFQTWNEPNNGTFFNGSPKQMAALNLAAYQAVHATTVKRGKAVRKYPSAKLVGPGFTTRLSPQITWMQNYLKATGGNKLDVVALHLYGLPGRTPESAIDQLTKARRYLKVAKIDTLPLYVTEVSFGAAVGGVGPAETISPALQAAYVARFLLLARSNGVARVYWYAWNNQSHKVSIDLTKADGKSLTDAGKAYQTTRTWLSQPLVGCVRASTGTWTCTVKQKRGSGYVVWNPSKKVRIAAPAATVSVTSVVGKKTALKAGKALTVTTSPQYIATSK
ncbi:putative glycosyl hydrolase [Motilibacter rhizosphaerae]|uniref:Putative glycosyl hydrolase n=1 Tax=Motilibacter rhizosphaerae TaxID=598652 RepID=A0A4Q7NYR5_9ACTN|nr:glycosyl hydrolase [Motilibacter rhizosphaerae]RZS91552.1 putative glycosyl hydrolase [Motilibacter rhizosphaerae]